MSASRAVTGEGRFITSPVLAGLLLSSLLLACGCKTSTRRTSAIDETTQSAIETTQRLERAVEAQKVELKIRDAEGNEISANVPPKQEINYENKDNSDSATQFQFKQTYYMAAGVSILVFIILASALLLIAYTLWTKLTLAGKATDTAIGKSKILKDTIRRALEVVNHQLSFANTPEERERLHPIKNALDR